jgi:hypothetical protein
MDSQDRDRHRGDNKKHPETDPYPHPPHKSQHKPKLSKDHDPHTKPDPNDESIDHGVYEDRPRPPKINKRNLKLSELH